jgi:hypothetical protein
MTVYFDAAITAYLCQFVAEVNVSVDEWCVTHNDLSEIDVLCFQKPLNLFEVLCGHEGLEGSLHWYS